MRGIGQIEDFRRRVNEVGARVPLDQHFVREVWAGFANADIPAVEAEVGALLLFCGTVAVHAALDWRRRFGCGLLLFGLWGFWRRSFGGVRFWGASPWWDVVVYKCCLDSK